MEVSPPGGDRLVDVGVSCECDVLDRGEQVCGRAGEEVTVDGAAVGARLGDE